MTRPSRVPTLSRRDFLAVAGSGALLAACGAPTTGGRAAGGDGALIAATYIPPSYADLYPAFTTLLDTALEASDGELDSEMFDSGTLLNADHLVAGLIQGVCDVVFQTSSYVSSSYPVLGCYELPFVNEGTPQTLRALDPTGELFALINTELGRRGLRLLGSMPTAPEYIWTIEAPVRRPEDLAGMRIRTAGAVEGATVSAMGASPVSMSSAEVYEALERGTIDGMISYPGTVTSRDLQEVLRYGTEAQFGLYAVDAYCRKDWYDVLGGDQQAALLDAAVAYHRDGTENQLRVHAEQYFPAMEEAGMEIVTLTEQEVATFTQATSGVEQWWRDNLGDQELADRALSLVQNA